MSPAENFISFLIVVFVSLILLTKFFLIGYFQSIVCLRKIRKTGKHLRGVIISFNEEQDADGMKFYQLVFQYEIDGQVRRSTSAMRIKQKPLIGSNVNVIVSLENDTEAYINLEKEISSKITGLILIALMVLGLLLLTIPSFL